ncbi:hypothetical protein ASG52_10770 [Methylobacterium sp. Leaf456]|uniref:DUF4174 domain-containing protein n=1 Tax=Methylobacterium sp. Leaf456 TaxID=1736382 RepID=UPI0006F9DB68|nr:DUF4174 domain-containing protein [Methylobacterium sp. Leaf456]KQT47744.1 hypothetical protein ASG52_10770 [Methylobacterium sp. Leaf456]
MRTKAVGVALAALTMGGAAMAAGDPLERYVWKARVLVVSAPDAGDARLAAQRQALASARTGLSERDLVTVEAVGGDAEAVAIRKPLGLPADAFRAVLVGKDGGAKLTSPEPIPPQRLFSTIDAMPMRKDEMRR